MAAPDSETIADWIRAGAYGTKSALAKRCGVTPTEVGRWAKGEMPNQRHWRTIEQFFGKPKGSISRSTGSRAADAGLGRRVAALEKEMAAQRALLEDLRGAVRELGSLQRSRQ